MKKFMFVLSFAAVGLCAESWKGVITDAKCGAAHAGEKLNEKCVRACIKGGQAAILVTTDGKVLKIHNAADAMVMKPENQGVKVEVTGHLMDGDVHVESIKTL